MLKDLPKLFGRAFAIGFLLPAVLGAALWATLAGTLGSGLLAWLASVDTGVELIGTAGVVWLLAVLLMALNRPVYRAYEGYSLWPAWWKRFLEARTERRFKELRAELRSLDVAYRKRALTDARTRRRARLTQMLVDEFPEEKHLLPTRFGNVLRAFEVYSRIMYGLDDIPGWVRLTAVLPADVREQVDNQKALTDFWLNLRVVATLALGLVLILVVTGERPFWALPLAALLFVPVDWTLAYAARAAAVQWGYSVKAAYDVFLPALHEKMAFEAPTGAEAQRRQWEAFSRAVIYRHPDSLPDRTLS